MYRFIVVVVVLNVVLAKLDTSIEKCHELETKSMHCCVSIHKQVDKVRTANAKIIKNETVDMKECSEIPLTQPCDRANCIGKKIGLVSEDGKVIKEALEKIFEEELHGATDFIEAVKDSCFKGNIADLEGPPEMCEFLKVNNCINIQAISLCTEWNKSSHCAGIEDLVKECMKSDS